MKQFIDTKKRIVAFLLVMVCTLAYMPIQEAKATDGYYYWQVTSISNMGLVYDGWMEGPSGGSKDNSGTVTLSRAVSVSNSISGSFTSKGDITAAIGFNVSRTDTVTASYAVTSPKGYKTTIKFRKKYTKYKVVQTQYYKIDGYSTKTSNTKTCYVKKFESFDYTSTQKKL